MGILGGYAAGSLLQLLAYSACINLGLSLHCMPTSRCTHGPSQLIASVTYGDGNVVARTRATPLPLVAPVGYDTDVTDVTVGAGAKSRSPNARAAHRNHPPAQPVSMDISGNCTTDEMSEFERLPPTKCR